MYYIPIWSVFLLFVTASYFHHLNQVHLYAIARTGHVPQIFNLKMSLQGRPIIQDLLEATGGKALLYDPSFVDDAKNISNIPSIVVPDIQTIPALQKELPELPDVQDVDMGMIFHTSGTTSGRPKPVPETHQWLRCQAQVQWPGIWQGKFATQGMFNNLGSFSNVGSATSACSFYYLGSI